MLGALTQESLEAMTCLLIMLDLLRDSLWTDELPPIIVDF